LSTGGITIRPIRLVGRATQESCPPLFTTRLIRGSLLEPMIDQGDEYIPALRFHWLTPFYDPLIRLAIRESTFKRRLLEQMRLESGHRLLDLGCGTATLTILIRQQCPQAEVIGLDVDLRVLEIARRKVARAGLTLPLHRGLAYDLPYPDSTFDRVVSSLMFHHLTHQDKIRTANEAFRVLRPGGELHVADLGRPHHALMALISLVTRRLEQAVDNVKGLLPVMFQEAGFDAVEETAQYMTPMGTLALYWAKKSRLSSVNGDS